MWGVKEGGLRVGKLEGMVVVIRVWIDSLKRWVGEGAMSQSELDLAYMGCVVITCFLTSGLIDAVAFNSWNCFVRMQTGMTGSTMV